nr:PTS sugar transporter subunit IIC [Clostridium frigoris]
MLGIGLLCETLGKFMHWQAFIGIGTIAKSMLAPALGAGVAYQLKGNTCYI